MSISLIQTDNMELVREVITDPDIWARISDGVEAETFYPTTNCMNKWLMVVDGEEGQEKIIGIIYVHCDTSCSVGFHPYLRKKQGKKGRAMVKAFFKWFIESIPAEYVKINVVIPECFKTTINLALKTGFKQEGISRQSYLHQGECLDRVMMGITRKEALKWVA